MVALNARRQGSDQVQTPQTAPKVAGAGSPAFPSPVHELHRAAERAFSQTPYAPEPYVAKWPGWVRIMILLLGAVLPWAGLMVVLTALLD